MLAPRTSVFVLPSQSVISLPYLLVNRESLMVNRIREPFRFTIHDFDSLRPERHPHALQQRPRLLVVSSGCDDRDIHASKLVDFVEINLRED